MIKTLSLILLLAATQMQAVLEFTPSKHKNHIDICGKPVYIGYLVIRALLDGDAASLSALLKIGCIDVNEKIVGHGICGWNGQRRTPLEWITTNDWRMRQEKYPFNRGECVKILIKAGANINTVDQNGNNLLKEAIENKQTDVLEILIAAGADVNNSTGNSNLLEEAIRISYVDGVRLLLMAPNINIDNKKNMHKTPFDYATQDYFNFQILELFQEYFRQQETLKAENEILKKEQAEQQAVLKKQHDAKKLAAWHDFNTRKEGEDKSTGKVLVLNPSETNLQLTHNTDVPAQSKAVITTEISKI